MSRIERVKKKDAPRRIAKPHFVCRSYEHMGWCSNQSTKSIAKKDDVTTTEKVTTNPLLQLSAAFYHSKLERVIRCSDCIYCTRTKPNKTTLSHINRIYLNRCLRAFVFFFLLFHAVVCKCCVLYVKYHDGLTLLRSI